MKKRFFGLLVILFLMIVGLNGVKAADKVDPCSKHITKQSVCDECGFVYNKKYKFCSNTGLAYVACGLTSKKNTDYSDVCKGDKSVVGMGVYDIPPRIPELTSFAVNLLRIVTPVILIFMGMVTMVKAVSSSNDDEIKKAQRALVKKIMIAVMIFFVVSITQFVVAKVSDSASKSLNSCLDLFLNGNYSTVYYRTGNEGKTCYTITQQVDESINEELESDGEEDEEEVSSSGGSTTHKSSSGETHGGNGGSWDDSFIDPYD